MYHVIICYIPAIVTRNAQGVGVVDEIVQVILDSGIFPDDQCFLRRIALVESKFGTDPNTYRAGYFGGIWQVRYFPVSMSP